MKPVISLPYLMILFFISCKQVDHKEVTNTDSLTVKPSPEMRIDTIAVSMSGGEFTAYGINVQQSPAGTPADAVLAAMGNLGVKISGGQRAYFTASKGRLALLIEGKDSLIFYDGKNQVPQYAFVAHIPQIAHYLIKTVWPEYTEFLLVNTKTAETIKLIGWPKINSDTTMLAAARSDVVAGHSFNGIQLITLKDKHSLSRQCLIKIDDWGPAQVHWMDNRSLLIKAEFFSADTLRQRMHRSEKYFQWKFNK